MMARFWTWAYLKKVASLWVYIPVVVLAYIFITGDPIFLHVTSPKEPQDICVKACYDAYYNFGKFYLTYESVIRECENACVSSYPEYIACSVGFNFGAITFSNLSNDSRSKNRHAYCGDRYGKGFRY